MIERARVDHGSRTGAPLALLISLSLSLLLTGACGTKKPAGDGGPDDAAIGSGGGSGSGGGGSSGAGGTSFDASGFDINLNDVNLGDLKLDLNFNFDVNVTTCPTGVKTGDSCANATACTAGANGGCLCFAAKWTCVGT